MAELASKTCIPCRGGVPPLAGKGWLASAYASAASPSSTYRM